MMNPRVLASTDLFVLDLWRTYPTGLRAEGLAVAEELMRQRSRALVVSPLALGGEVDLPWYWDLGTVDTLEARCAGLLRMPPRRWMHGEESSDRLKELLGSYLLKPQGHE